MAEDSEQYSTTWCQPSEMPTQGVECPKCKKGQIFQSKYGGLWCPECKWKWKISQWGDKKQASTSVPGKVTNEQILDEINKVKEACKLEKESLRIINENIKKIASTKF